jgi:phosphohistidine swiveling domain-containing protein
MFMRSKKIKGKKYYYLVKSVRTKNNVKKIEKYIGKKRPTEKQLKKHIDSLQNKDQWMLAEDIPDIDVFFSQIWLSCFANQFAWPAGKAYKKVLTIFKGYHLWFYYGTQDSNDVGEHIVNKFKQDPQFAVLVNKQIMKEADTLRAFAEKLPTENLQKLTDSQLWKCYKQYDAIHTEYYQWCWIPVAVDMFHNNLTNFLKAYLKEKNISDENVNEYFTILTQPTEKSLIIKEQEEFLRIAADIKKNKKLTALFKEFYTLFQETEAAPFGLATHTPAYEHFLEQKITQIKEKIDSEIIKRIEQHYLTYHYVKHMWVGKDGVHSFDYYLKEIVKFIGKNSDPVALLTEKELAYRKMIEKRELLIKKLQIKQPWLILFSEFGNFMVTKIYRRYAQIYAIYMMQQILEEIASRLKISLMQMKFMLTAEVSEALQKGKINRKELEERTKFCVYLVDGTKETVYTGKKAEELAKEIERKEIKNITQIQGQTGCVGKATGTVKLIIRPTDMPKMKQGDILVSIATDPDIVPAMKRAAAIVTEQGGVTSHAAIVARELNIPCVIGTKIATQVLKDGDVVEVDAYTGTVTILSEQGKNIIKGVKEEQKITMQIPIKEIQETHNPTRQEHILWFKEVNKKDVLSVGGKGASLGEMHSIMPVPDGFCITVAAYKEVLKEHHDEILRITEKRNSESLEELEAVSNIIKSKIINIEIPREIQCTIRENYNKLKGKVAVRSSATTEDLDEASFAGQQDTFLNVEGEENVLAAVKKCWASLFNARAIHYREKNNFKHDQAFLSVVVQKMVNAEKAGVMFTTNPINKSREEMIIEACFGLGEKLVSGEITPDSFIIDKKQETAKQEFLNFEKKTLDAKELKELIRIGKQIESHYKKPMDIEWAIENNKVYILQARPITTM